MLFVHRRRFTKFSGSQETSSLFGDRHLRSVFFRLAPHIFPRVEIQAEEVALACTLGEQGDKANPANWRDILPTPFEGVYLAMVMNDIF